MSYVFAGRHLVTDSNNFCFHAYIFAVWLSSHSWPSTGQLLYMTIHDSKSKWMSKLCYDGHSIGQSVWCQAPSGVQDQIFVTVRQLVICWCEGALSDERPCLLFTVAAGPRQRSHSRIRFPWESLTYFTVSESRLPFSSPHNWVWVLYYDRRSVGRSVLE
jgi:hypothetical protein